MVASVCTYLVLLKLCYYNAVQVFFSAGQYGNVIALDGSCQQAYDGRYSNLELLRISAK